MRLHTQSHATFQNWVAQFKRGDFSTCDAARPGRPWKKLGYITMTRKQNNNQWSGGIADHPTPPPQKKNSECKTPLENFSPRIFGINMAFSSLIIFQRTKLSTHRITHFCWCN
jgi:hypothetical protein